MKQENLFMINGKDEKAFLEFYNYDFDSVSEIGLDWHDLVGIHDNYSGCYRDKFEIEAKHLFWELKNIKGAHTVKYRIKDPEHLIDKIIRKKVNEGRIITKDSYLEEFDDFIGFRILHLFKTDWEDIYDALKAKYECKETPVAYHRVGDDEHFILRCKELGLDAKEKEAGYRSIHYIAKFPCYNSDFKCEIQIRTIFEEAWSEIDHLIRYPNNTENELLNSYLLMFNRLAGCADDMGTFLMAMKRKLVQQQNEHDEFEIIVNQLREEISKLKGKNATQSKKIDELMVRLGESLDLTAPGSLLGTFAPVSHVDFVSRILNPSTVTMDDPYMTHALVSTLNPYNSISAHDGTIGALSLATLTNVPSKEKEVIKASPLGLEKVFSNNLSLHINSETEGQTEPKHEDND